MMGFLGLILSFFISLSTYSQELFPRVEDSAPNLSCVSEGTELETCFYERRFADTQFLITQSNYTIGGKFGTPGFIPKDKGYVRMGPNSKIIVFSFYKDKALLEEFKRFLLTIDKSPMPNKNREAHFLVNVYLLSTQRALEKGFNFDFLKDGLVEENTPRLAGGGNLLNWNIGNLVNQALSITFKRARTNGIVVNSDSIQFWAEHGSGSPISSHQLFYRDGKSLSTDSETAPRSISGTVALDAENPKKITFSNFNMQFYIPINTDNSMIRTVTISKPALYLESGVQQTIVSQDELTQIVSKETGILSVESSQVFNQFKIIVSIIGYTDLDRDVNTSDFEESRKLYTFTPEQLETLSSGTGSDIENLLHKENLNAQLIKSPIGYLGESIAIQYRPNQITKTMKSTKVLVSVKAQGLRSKPIPLSLENLLAGPLLLDEEFFDTAYLEKNRNGKISFQFIVEEDPDYVIPHRELGVSQFKRVYNFIYNVKNGTLDLISESSK